MQCSGVAPPWEVLLFLRPPSPGSEALAEVGARDGRMPVSRLGNSPAYDGCRPGHNHSDDGAPEAGSRQRDRGMATEIGGHAWR